MGRRHLVKVLLAAAVASTLLMGEARSAPLEKVQRSGTSWTAPVTITSVAPNRDVLVSSPLVTLAPEGDITVVWSREERVLSRTRQAGGGWGPVLTVGTGSPEDLDVDADGDVTLVWGHDLRGERTVLLTSRRPDGGRWSRPHRLSRVPVRRGVFLGSGGARLDVNSRGDAVVAWAYGSPEHTNVEYRVEVSYRRSGGTWTPRTRLGRLDTLPAGTVIGSTGIPTVLTNHDGRLRAFRRLSKGWRPVGGPTSRRAWQTELTIGARGHVLASWATDTRRPSVRGSWFTADGWSPTRILTRQGSGWDHAAGVDRSGMATVAWESPSGRIRVVRWMRGRDLGAGRTLARRDASDVAVAVAVDGTAVVAWAGRVPGTFDWRARAVRRPQAGPWSATTTVSRRLNIGLQSLVLDSWPGGRAALAWSGESSRAIWLAMSR